MGGHGPGRRGGRAARQPRSPVHARRAVREGQPLPGADPGAPTASCTRCAGSAPRGRGGSSASPGTRPSTRSPTRLRGIIDEYGGEAIWPYQGTGSLGYLQGEEGGAGRRLWNALGASRARPQHLLRGGRHRAAADQRHPGGMDPETFALSKLILLWGTNPLTSGHHVWKFVQRGPGERRVRGRDRPDPHPDRRAGRRAPADPAGHRRRARARADATWCWPRARRTASSSRSTRVGWEEFREEILRVSRRSGWRRSPACPRRHPRASGVRLAHTRPTGIRATHGRAAARGRRHRDAHDRRASPA